MGGVGLPAPTLSALEWEKAADFIISRCREHPVEVTVVAIGNLTNLMMALKAEP